jgi:hypothetical protein
MADEVKSEFSQQVVEPPQKSEFELVQERITNYTIPVTPKNAQTISSILELGLAKGNFKLSELDSLVSIREEVNKGLIEYQTQVQVAQRRLQELQEEETARIVKEREDVQNELFSRMTEERQNRKKVEEELRLVKAQLDALSNVQGNVTSAPITSGGNAPSVTGEKPEPNLQPEPKVPGKTSPAFAVARALNPVKEEEPISNDSEFNAKVEETKKSFKEWEESKEEIVLDIPEDAKGTEDFFKEVAKVEEESEELIPEEDFDEEEQNFLDEELEDLGEDLPVDELDLFEEELKVAEEDTTTQPTFPITGGNAPNLKGQVSAPQKVSAVYDSEEELLKAVQDKIDAKKQQEEEEYDEIVIPSSDELENMTKKQIQSAGKELGFKLSTTDTKDVMIQSFLEQTQEFIQDLQDSGEFVSASDEDEDDKNEDVRDGGYF